jgi:hypothetical protein
LDGQPRDESGVGGSKQKGEGAAVVHFTAGRRDHVDFVKKTVSSNPIENIYALLKHASGHVIGVLFAL